MAKGKRAKSEEVSQAAPNPELKALGVFVGTWDMEGEQFNSTFGPEAKITGRETFEWLQGGWFLMHRLDGHLDSHTMACIEVIGYDPAHHNYPVHTFYNNGETNHWCAREHAGVWTLAGEWRSKNGPVSVRCTNLFSDDGKTRTDQWVRSEDGINWDTFWVVKATKVVV